MVKAVFHKDGLKSFGSTDDDGTVMFSGFEISGHAGYGTEGNDIVCAAISSCTMLVCNCVSENFGAKVAVKVEENRITLRLSEYNEAAVKLLSAFYEHLKVLSEDYSNIVLSVR